MWLSRTFSMSVIPELTRRRALPGTVFRYLRCSSATTSTPGEKLAAVAPEGHGIALKGHGAALRPPMPPLFSSPARPRKKEGIGNLLPQFTRWLLWLSACGSGVPRLLALCSQTPRSLLDLASLCRFSCCQSPRRSKPRDASFIIVCRRIGQQLGRDRRLASAGTTTEHRPAYGAFRCWSANSPEPPSSEQARALRRERA